MSAPPSPSGGLPLGGDGYPAAGGVARRPAGPDESARANRRWWDAAAPAYLAEHGGDLGDADFLWCPEGLREADARLRDPAGGPRGRIDSHDPADVLAALPDALWVLVEGGPHILGAFFAAGLVDEVHAYVAPLVLGAGRSSVEIPGVTTLDDAQRFSTRSVTRLGEDVLVTLSRPSTTPRDS